MSMRIMMLGPYPRSRRRVDGGVAAATMYVSQALTRLPGVELIGVRVAGARLSRGQADDLGWPVHDLELARFSVSTLFRRQQRQLAALIRQFKPDLIHAQGADASGYLAVRSDCPAVVTIHGILVECAKFQTNVIKRIRELTQAHITERYVVERAANVVAINPYVSDYYSGRLKGSIFDIPNAVSARFFEIERRPEARRLLFAGRISKGKGLIDLVRAVALQPGVIGKVVLAGSTPDREFESELRGEIRRNGLENKFELPGLLDEDSLLTEFSRASALVLPSYQETAPMVIQQAMAAGLPVIATRVGGIPFQIEHDSGGLLFESGDVSGLAGQCERLLGNSRLAADLAATARARALESFTAEKVGQATRAVYQKILSSEAAVHSSK